MDEVTFAEQLWEIIEPFITVKQRPAVANSLADLLGDFDLAEDAVMATDWYAEYATQSVADDTEDEEE